MGYLLDPSNRAYFVWIAKVSRSARPSGGRDTLYARLHNDIAGNPCQGRRCSGSLQRVGGFGWVHNLSNQGGFDGLGLEVYKAGEGSVFPRPLLRGATEQTADVVCYHRDQTMPARRAARPAWSLSEPGGDVAELDRQMALA